MLRNKLQPNGEPYGIDNAEQLKAAEEKLAAYRILELSFSPIEGQFDYAHFKRIHGYIFQDIYEWAGEERTAPTNTWMNKGGHRYYPAGPALTEAAEAQFKALARANYLRGLEPHEFVTQLAEFWGEINVIHSFREGNTRTQFVFFSQLCVEASFVIDSAKFAVGSKLRERFVEARFHSQTTGSNRRLAAVLT